nr:hypothetical protein [Elusimicrobiaceae bacterium]
MKKILVASLSLALLASVSFAARVKNAEVKTTVETEVPVTVIVMDDDATGGVDNALNSGLEQALGAKLKVTTVNRSAALQNPKYQGLNLDFMPLYLVEKTKLVDEKFGQYIKMGQLKEVNGFVVFEHQTRNGVYANKAL